MSKNNNPKNNNPKGNQKPSTPKTESNTGRGNSLNKEKGSGQFGKGMTISPQKPKKQ